LTGFYKIKSIDHILLKIVKSSLELPEYGCNIKKINTNWFDISFYKQLLNVNGKIYINSADIKPMNYSSIDTLSDDVKFVSYSKKSRKDNQKIRINSKIEFVLGENVKVNVLGLYGSVKGGLYIINNSDSENYVDGKVWLQNGYYKFLGKKIKINSAELKFNKAKIDRPYLSLYLIKRINSQNNNGYRSNTKLVGVHVFGMITDPVVSFFSDPKGLSKSDIISYLVTGRSFVDDSGVDKKGAALQFLSVLVSPFIDSFKKGVGFNVMNIENNSFVIGKNLSSKIYISYSIGLIDPVSTVKLRYNFNKKLYVESTSSNVGNGVDLFYSVKRN